jgi:hypothetical protein
MAGSSWELSDLYGKSSLSERKSVIGLVTKARRIRGLLRRTWRDTKGRFIASSGASATTLLVGNKQAWRDTIVVEMAISTINLCIYPLNAETIDLPEIDFILPFVLSEYDVIRASPIALTKSLVPPEAGVALADDKLHFNNWLISVGLGHCVPKMLENGHLSYPFIRKKRIDAWGENSQIFFSEDQMRLAGVNIHDRNYILQECTSGQEEYATHTISISGVITYAVTFLNFYDRPL